MEWRFISKVLLLNLEVLIIFATPKIRIYSFSANEGVK
jgi:hypothetical protein